MTTFAELYPMIRVLLGDTDTQVVMFSDAVLNSHIRLRIMTDNDLNVQEDGTSAIFTAVLTATQKALIILKVAKALISPVANKFSYRNVVHSVSREGGSQQLLAYLDDQIIELESSNGSLMRFDTEIAAILNGALRFQRDYQAALVVDGGG